MIITFDSKKAKQSSGHPSSATITQHSTGSNSAHHLLPSNGASHIKLSTTSDTSALKIVDGDPLNRHQTKRSRRGCLTCKIRKKKCNEGKPVCSDCFRLKKECVYIDPETMDPQYIKEVKLRVEKAESGLKLRKRKRAGLDDIDRVPDTPLDTRLVESHFTESPQGESLAIKRFSYNERASTPNSPDISNLLNHDFEPSQVQSELQMQPLQNPQHIGTQNPQNPQHPDHTSHMQNPQRTDHINEPINDPIQQANVMLLTRHLKTETEAKHKHKIRPIEEIKQEPEQFSAMDESPPSESARLNEVAPLREQAALNEAALNEAALNEAALDEAADALEDEALEEQSLMRYEEMSSVGFDKLLSKFKAGSPDPQRVAFETLSNHSSPDLISYLRNNTFLVGENIPGLSPNNPWGPSPDYNQLMSLMQSPSPRLNANVLSDLSNRAHYLYDYYVNVISNTVSVAPVSKKSNENYYQQVFLPLAQNDKGVMYSILAWACFHLGQPEDIKEGMEYIKRSLTHFHSQTGTDKLTVINKISSLLIMLGAEICRGDVKNWTKYLDWGSKLLNSMGGINSCRSTKQEFWLISNFAYHDVLSSNNLEKGLHFTSTEYSEVFTNDMSSGILHPLMGIAKEIYWRIGEISSLAFETNQKLTKMTNDLNEKNVSDSPDEDYTRGPAFDFADKDELESEISNHAKINEMLLSVKSQAQGLDKKIDDVKPDPRDLFELDDEEFEWQITLLETFKLSAKLYLRQAILKCNPSSLESQILTNDLIKCLDIVLGSPVEASLVFPVFIASIHCVSKHDRRLMTSRIDKFIQTYGPWSLLRSKTVIDRIWELNPDGDKVVDWHAVLREMGWNINFA